MISDKTFVSIYNCLVEELFNSWKADLDFVKIRIVYGRYSDDNYNWLGLTNCRDLIYINQTMIEETVLSTDYAKLEAVICHEICHILAFTSDHYNPKFLRHFYNAGRMAKKLNMLDLASAITKNIEDIINDTYLYKNYEIFMEEQTLRSILWSPNITSDEIMEILAEKHGMTSYEFACIVTMEYIETLMDKAEAGELEISIQEKKHYDIDKDSLTRNMKRKNDRENTKNYRDTTSYENRILDDKSARARR